LGGVGRWGMVKRALGFLVLLHDGWRFQRGNPHSGCSVIAYHGRVGLVRPGLCGHRAQALAANGAHSMSKRNAYWYKAGGEIQVVAFDSAGGSERLSFGSLAKARGWTEKNGMNFAENDEKGEKKPKKPRKSEK